VVEESYLLSMHPTISLNREPIHPPPFGRGLLGYKVKMKDGYKKFLRALVISAALALAMIYIALGLMFFAKEGIPWANQLHFILLIAAVFFIIFTVFYESRSKAKDKGKDIAKSSLQSILKGFFLSICATFAVVAIACGVLFMIEGGVQVIGGIEVFISALAICMIVSMVLLILSQP
jgi:hypothetical protein